MDCFRSIGPFYAMLDDAKHMNAELIKDFYAEKKSKMLPHAKNCRKYPGYARIYEDVAFNFHEFPYEKKVPVIKNNEPKYII